MRFLFIGFIVVIFMTACDDNSTNSSDIDNSPPDIDVNSDLDEDVALIVETENDKTDDTDYDDETCCDADDISEIDEDLDSLIVDEDKTDTDPTMLDADCIEVDDDNVEPDSDNIEDFDYDNNQDDDNETAECIENDIKTESCGFNNNGEMNYICESGLWVNHGCIDNDICTNNTTQEIKCGYNNNGTQEEICTDGKWITSNDCTDPDECKSGYLKKESGVVSRCVDGKWNLLRKSYKWSSKGYEPEYAYSSVMDNDENIYVIGNTEGAFENFTNLGSYDIFITKIDKNGEIKWTQQLGTSEDDNAKSIVIDNENYIYISGSTKGSMDGNGGNGNYDIFIVKFDNSGNLIWTKQFGTSENDYSFASTISNENIYIAGHTEGNLDNNINKGKFDAFITKLDKDGNILWTDQWGDEGNEYIYSVSSDNDGNIYTTGNVENYFSGNYTFTTKTDAQGKKLWKKQWDTSYSFSQITVKDNNIYLLGNLDYYPILIITDTSGSELSNKTWSTTKAHPTSMIIDSKKNIYACGFLYQNFSGYTNAGALDVFVAKLNSKGGFLWAQQWGSVSYDTASSVLTDSSGNIYVTGYVGEYFDGYRDIRVTDLFLSVISAKY